MNTGVYRHVVLSPYMRNISPTVLDCQRRVFERFGIPLEQVLVDSKEHGEWLDDVSNSAPDGSLISISDIDAFPLSKQAYENAVSTVQSNRIFGLAQANPLDDKAPYAGPMTFMFLKETFDTLGRPSLKRTPDFDAGQRLSHEARRAGVGLELYFPNAVIQPRWAMSKYGIFGTGTFYGNNRFFHLFESRKSRGIKLMEMVAEDVVSGELNFERYIRMSMPLADRVLEFRKKIRRLI